ncbi:MAG: hypothetical protein AB2L09_02250 [Coriobacteriia bacterium]
MTPTPAETNTPLPPNVPLPTAPLKQKPVRGRMLAGIAGIVVLVAVVAGIALYWGLGLFSSGTQAVVTTNSPIVVTPVAASDEESSSASTETTEAPLSDTFTFRNVFKPTVKATYAAVSSGTGTSGTDGTGTGSGSVTTDPDTLYLVGTTLSPTKAATILWNGTTYTLPEGAQVGSSPWRVEAIYSDSVLMLYGENAIPVAIGQSISK